MTLVALHPQVEVSAAVAELMRDYDKKRFQYQLQGIDQRRLADYHLQGLRKQVAAGGMRLSAVEYDGRVVGVAGLTRHARHSDVFGCDMWYIAPLLFRGLGAAAVAGALRLLEREAAAAGAKLLSARVDVEDYALLQGLGEAGWINVGTSVKLTRVLNRERPIAPATGDGVTVEEVAALSADEADMLERIAAAGHTHSHFFNDPRLDPDAARRLFADWATRCARLESSRTWLARLHARCVGFLTALFNPGVAAHTGRHVGVIDFIVLAPEAQGKGLGTLLVQTALAELAASCDLIEIRTMLDNFAALRLYQRCGAVLSSADVHAHRWLAY